MDITVAIDKLDKIGVDGVNKELNEKGVSDAAIQKLQPVISFKGNQKENIDLLKKLIGDTEVGKKGSEEIEFVFDPIANCKLRPKTLRRQGAALPERVAEHRALGAELNVLDFVTIILPPEIVDAPRHGSLCFHPSLLPKYRGGNALAWQILLGETESGVSVFRPDAGVDTGPIVVRKGGVVIEPHHTAASLYFEKLYALGVEAMVEAVALAASGRARPAPQDEARASFQGLVTDEVARLRLVKERRRARPLDPRLRPEPGGARPLARRDTASLRRAARLERADVRSAARCTRG